jgi:hypothetical protein
MPRSYESKSRRSKPLFFRLPIVAATIGAFGVEITAASAAPLGQKMIVEEFGNALAVRTGEPKDTTDAEKLSAKDLEERGIKLRTELEKTFDKLGAAR